MAVILLQQQLARSRRNMSGYPAPSLLPEPKKARWYHKRWIGVGEDGSHASDRFWKRKNAQVYCDEMNNSEWNPEFFGGIKFVVRRVDHIDY